MNRSRLEFSYALCLRIRVFRQGEQIGFSIFMKKTGGDWTATYNIWIFRGRISSTKECTKRQCTAQPCSEEGTDIVQLCMNESKHHEADFAFFFAF